MDQNVGAASESQRYRRRADVPGSLQKRVDRHLLACAAATALSAAGEQAQAAIQYSGLLDLPVDATRSSGIYIDVDGLLTDRPPPSNPQQGTILSAWDLNIFNVNFSDPQEQGKGVFLYTPAARPAAAMGNKSGDGAYAYVSRLGAGVTVGPAGPFISPPPPTGFAYPFFTYSDATPPDQYPLPGVQWSGGVTNGFMGFRFTAADNQTHFGWARLNIGTRAQNHQIVLRDFAWETSPNTPIATGAIPEPSLATALGFLALGAAGIRPTRRLRELQR
ncbi:hypothetical protein [Fontivita pretiosa]|uniref:hypothetical protein n=1 Tax=Fontivita pretiosa TaxID=2989684 RepID=UPI003D16963C